MQNLPPVLVSDMTEREPTLPCLLSDKISLKPTHYILAQESKKSVKDGKLISET